MGKFTKILNKTWVILVKISIIKTIFYSYKFRAKIIVGRGTKLNLQKNSQIIINKGILLIGVDHSLPQKTVLDIYRDGKLIINGKVMINKGTKVLIGQDAVLSIGNKSFINEHSRIQCRKKISIGEECAISWNVNILDTNEHNLILDGVEQEKNSEVFIGDRVWIGCNVTVLKGTTISDGSVIGAGTVVSKSTPANSLSVGSPNKVIKENVSWVL